MTRSIRGWIAWAICVYTPLDRICWRAFMWLLPYAGDWIYREEIRQAKAEEAA